MIYSQFNKRWKLATTNLLRVHNEEQGQPSCRCAASVENPGFDTTDPVQQSDQELNAVTPLCKVARSRKQLASLRLFENLASIHQVRDQSFHHNSRVVSDQDHARTVSC